MSIVNNQWVTKGCSLNLVSIATSVIIVTGVSGSGKTTIGLALAEKLDASFYDGDTFHPESNIVKMSSGIPLTDEDREPWLLAINDWIKKKLPSENLIIACSALKESYRKILVTDIDPSLVTWVHLQGGYDIIFKRMNEREGHYMSASMLRSQFETYEVPAYGIKVNIDQHVVQIINDIITEIEKAI